MITWSLWAAWMGILLGMVSGAVFGLHFHDDGWLGGYGSWPRRLLRLGHISFFGIALLNLAFGATLAMTGTNGQFRSTSVLLVAGAILMPAVCFLSAWRKPLRHLFVLPVVSLFGAAVSVLVGVLA